MIATYQDKDYWLDIAQEGLTLVTHKAEKAGNGFEEDLGTFRKPVSDGEVSDIFTVCYIVGYGTGIPGVPHVWIMDTDMSEPAQEKLCIRHAQGQLPGWTKETERTCTKFIRPEDADMIKVVYAYTQRGNVALEDPVVRESVLSPAELNSSFEQYRKMNL